MADSKLCAGCKRGGEDITAVSWCSDCSELVCKACSRVHEKMSPPHKLVPMKEIQQLSSVLLKLSNNCKDHPDQKIVLYCCQHDKEICDSCVPVSHKNCTSIISIEKAARGVQDGTAISDLERRISNLCQVIENRQSQNEKSLVDLEKSRTNIKKRVSKIKQKIIAYLDTLEAEIHKDIDSKYETCTEMVSRNINSIQSSSNSLFAWKSDLKSLKQHTSEIYLFKVVKFLDVKTHQKELEIRDIQTATVPTIKYHPSESESNIQKLVQDFGTIKVENVQVSMSALDTDQQGQFLVRDERKFSLAHSFHQTKLSNKGSINSGCFISDDKLLLSHCKHKKLSVCSLDGSTFNEINLDYVPENVTFYDKNHAVVSVGADGIQIIELASLKPGRRIKVEGICRGITSVKDQIWVANKSRTLTIVDIQGKVLKVIQTTFDLEEICANKDSDVYCTDFFTDTVYAVTKDGKERVIYHNPDLKYAVGVAVDDRGDVYVAGLQSNNIHRISYNGQNQGIVLTGDDGIYRPGTLSYNNETRELLVIIDCNKSINIYKTQ